MEMAFSSSLAISVSKERKLLGQLFAWVFLVSTMADGFVMIPTSRKYHVPKASSSQKMIEKPEDYYKAFGESSSQSFHFPTQGEGNMNPPPMTPLKSFSKSKEEEKGGNKEAIENAKQPPPAHTQVTTPKTPKYAVRNAPESSTTPFKAQAANVDSSNRKLKRYQGPNNENSTTMATATKPMSRVPSPSTTPFTAQADNLMRSSASSSSLKRYQGQQVQPATFHTPSNSSTRIQFREDTAGMMLEVPSVLPKLIVNQFMPSQRINNNRRVVLFQPETSGGPNLDATPTASVPQPTKTAALSSTFTTTTSNKSPSSSSKLLFVRGDAGGNIILQNTETVPQPKPVSPLRAHQLKIMSTVKEEETITTSTATTPHNLFVPSDAAGNMEFPQSKPNQKQLLQHSSSSNSSSSSSYYKPLMAKPDSAGMMFEVTPSLPRPQPIPPFENHHT